MKADYSAAKLSRFRRVRTGIYSAGSSADYHYRSDADYLRIIEYARDMDRNDAVIGQMVDRAVLNTVQNGLVPDPQTGDVELNTALLKRFTSWAKDKLQCDLAGVLTFAAMQEQVLRAMLIDGDIFALPTDTGALELVESHRCRTPTNTTRNVVHGIMLDAHRRRLEFWFTKDDIDPNMSLSRVSDVQAYQAFDSEGWPAVFHVFNPKRVSQTRGVSALAPVFDVAGMFEDIQFAKLVQQQVVSCFAIIRQLSPDSTDVQSPRLGDQELDTYSDGVRKLVEQIAPGMELTGNPGETISGFSPQVPNPGAMEHFRLMLTLLGINLGLPLVMVTMDASDTNFSGWRGAVDQARMGFKRNQAWLIDNFLTPVYRWKVRQWTDPNSGDPRLIAAAKKLIQSGGDLYAHAWSTPKWPYIQPLQDAQADALRVEKRQISPRRQLAERGLDIDDIRVETIADNGDWIVDAINKAKQIEKETGVTVDWHELLYVPNVIDQKPGLPGSPTTTAEPQGTVNDA
jgi:lambda family phage portal protein